MYVHLLLCCVHPDNSTSWVETLNNACMVVDALGPAVRNELLAMVTERDVNHYKQIFSSPEASKLENTHRRSAKEMEWRPIHWVVGL